MNDDGFYLGPEQSTPAPGEPLALPPPLRSQRGGEGELVRRYLQGALSTTEAPAWQRLQAAVLRDGAPRPARRRAGWIFAGAGAVALVGALLWISKGARPSTTVAASSPTTATATPAAATAAATAGGAPAPVASAVKAAPAPATATPVAIDAHPRALAPGRWAWEGEASIDVGAGGAARAVWPIGGGPTVMLAAGRAALEVVHKPRPVPFRLSAGPYTFTVLGTIFAVERGATEVSLAVTQGRVAVSRAGRALALITAGGFWTGTLITAAPHEKAFEKTAERARAMKATPASATDASSVSATGAAQEKSDSPSCGGRGAPGQPPAARLSCWRAEASKGGLRAEVALYQIGSLARDELRDPAQALAAFEELRRRYPDGTLHTEAELSIVGLLARTGRYDDALSESAMLLGQRGGSERAAELHVLRGNVYREGKGDLARAAVEYRLAAAETGRPATVDEALFLRAVTLEALGQRAEAVDGYHSYLQRPHPTHESEARRRLDRLSPP